jgi:hypothetical protein
MVNLNLSFLQPACKSISAARLTAHVQVLNILLVIITSIFVPPNLGYSTTSIPTKVPLAVYYKTLFPLLRHAARFSVICALKVENAPS